jgi:hypothetical protein
MADRRAGQIRQTGDTAGTEAGAKVKFTIDELKAWRMVVFVRLAFRYQQLSVDGELKIIE